jgi:hypothetical protein
MKQQGQLLIFLRYTTLIKTENKAAAELYVPRDYQVITTVSVIYAVKILPSFSSCQKQTEC